MANNLGYGTARCGWVGSINIIKIISVPEITHIRWITVFLHGKWILILGQEVLRYFCKASFVEFLTISFNSIERVFSTSSISRAWWWINVCIIIVLHSQKLVNKSTLSIVNLNIAMTFISTCDCSSYTHWTNLFAQFANKSILLRNLVEYIPNQQWEEVVYKAMEQQK